MELARRDSGGAVRITSGGPADKDSLWEAFFSEDELLTAFGRLRAFVQANPDVPAVQALYCCMLWYVRTPDAVLEAQSVAARIVRTAPRSPWASFEAKIAEAERKAAEPPAAGTTGAVLPSPGAG